MRSFLLGRSASHVLRWHTNPILQAESLNDHHAYVARTAYVVAWLLRHHRIVNRGLTPDHVAVAALYHDEAELITGDSPSSLKSLFKARSTFKRWEARALPHLFKEAPPDVARHLRGIVRQVHYLTTVEKQIVSYADSLGSLAVAEDELRAGNQRLQSALDDIKHRLAGFQWPWLVALRGVYKDLP